MVDLTVCFDGLLPRVASIDDHLELARLNRLFADAGYLTGLALESWPSLRPFCGNLLWLPDCYIIN